MNHSERKHHTPEEKVSIQRRPSTAMRDGITTSTQVVESRCGGGGEEARERSRNVP